MLRLRLDERFADDFLAEDFFAEDFFAGDLREADFRADDFRADDFFALLRAGPRALDLRAPPLRPALFFPRDDDLRAGDFFEPRDDFLAAAIVSSSNVGVLLRHYSNFRAQKTTGF